MCPKQETKGKERRMLLPGSRGGGGGAVINGHRSGTLTPQGATTEDNTAKKNSPRE